MSTGRRFIKRSDMRWGTLRLVASIILVCSLQLMQTWNALAALVPEEEKAIEALRDTFNLPSWTSDPCANVTWLTCSSKSNKSKNVEIINLRSLNLTGTIPNALTKLRHLRELYLDHNKLVGLVPDLRNMTSLTQLDLSENNFTGPILDTTTLKNISQLILSGNNFTGGIPPSIFKHSTILKMRFDNSPLGGPIPDLSGLTSVKEFYISNNNLTGRIPNSVRNLTTATHIWFRYMKGITGPLPDLNVLFNVMYWDTSQCSLTGPLPEFYNSTQIQGMTLNDNNFTGSIPPALFSRHPMLQWLDMYNNPGLTGEIPDVSGLAAVEVFSIFSCNLTGPVPSFENNTKLRFLNLWDNRLTEFTSDLRNLTQLCILALENNTISSKLPDLPASSSQEKKKDYFLEKVKLTNNSFFGEIPQSWYQLSYLEVILLGRNNLSGVLPKEIRNFTNLKELHLHDNHFSGPLPEEIGLLSRLEILDLRNNHFSGIIPESLASIENLTLVWLDNNNFTGIPQALINKLGSNITFGNNTNIQIIGGKKSGLSTGGITGIAVGAAVAFIAVLALLLCVLKKKHEGELSRADMPKSARFFTLKDIKRITENNKTLIGKGGFGPVYYGKLSDGKEVAVKVRAADSKQGAREFLNEVRLLSRLHHRNLVPLVGYCLESHQQILVYDYMSQGTLADHLYRKVSGPDSLATTTTSSTTATATATEKSMTRELHPLNWRMRVEIAINAARGLEYLHKDCNPPVIHRDVKSSNILLGDKLQAKVTDLGISKQVPELENDEVDGATMTAGVSTAIKGTFGYLDPEYFVRRKLTTKSDVFSFGIVLLELITGKRPQTLDFPDSAETSLIDWVTNALELNEFESVVDPSLKGAYNEESMLKVARCALSAVATSGGERPEMGVIVDILTQALDLEGGNIYSLEKKHADEEWVPFSGQLKPPQSAAGPDELNPDSDVSYPTQTAKSFDA